MATTRPRWSLRTFFTHIGQAIFQPETSGSQPTSEQGVKELSKDSDARSDVVVVAGPSSQEPANPPSYKLSARSPITRFSNTQPKDSRTNANHFYSPVEKPSTEPSNSKHDPLQTSSSEHVGLTRTLKSANPAAVPTFPATQAAKAAQQLIPSVEPKTEPTSYLSLPLEIRQQILSYIVDPEEPSLVNATLTLTYRPATILSQVSHQVHIDTLYLHLQWRRKHNLQDILCPLWTGEDQKMFDELNGMIGYHVNTGRTQAQMNVAGAAQICWLLQTLDTLRAQKMEMKTLIDQLKTTVAMQREVNYELREENEKLVLALELRDMELGGCENP